jgi:hypothetical protein
VLEANVFERQIGELGKTRVLLTLLDGRPVHRDPSLAW